MSGACPTTEQLAAALRGKQSSPAEAELAAHLAECANCRARLEELAGGSGWLETRAKARGASLPPASESLHKAIEALESHAPGQEVKPETTSPLSFLQPSDQPGILGRFGPYEVIAQVAVGGMGIVLKARDPGLNRIVALKILPPALAANSLARARFIREARAAAAVVHEHVVPIYAVDECAGLPYLVMQFIEGRPLSERIRATGALRLEEILRIGAQTAAGLAAAHAQGLIHRDVKPGNILLENGVERVKITDFGLARAADDSSLTREGYIAGTPEYMSPEQARNEPVDQRADLFSFGSVLYEMATGVSPFHAEKPLVAMRRVCDEEPPLAHTLNLKLPEWLGQMIQRLMAKNAATRPQTAAEVAAELERRLAELQQSAHPGQMLRESPSRSGKTPQWLLRPAWALVAVLAPALAALLVYRPKPEPPSALFVIPAIGSAAEQGFATFAAAVAAAADGAVIECRFNGPQPIEAVRRIEKALILRAGDGFAPVLTLAGLEEPLLFIESPLVLEGLTLLAKSFRPRGASPREQMNRGGGMIIEGAPILVAYCRFEVAPDASIERPTPEFLSVVSVPVARFVHCEFDCGEAFALDWRVRPRSESRETANHLLVQDSVAMGNLILAARWSQQALRLDLHRNTLSGQSLLTLREPFPGQPLQVNAHGNMFAVDMLANSTMRAAGIPIENLLRWQGHSNAFSVTAYVSSSSSLNRHEDWLASDAVSETNSVSAELGLKARVTGLTTRTRAAEAAALALTAEERQQLTAQGWTSTEPPGADPRKTGPGKPYHDWRKSPDYVEWLKLVGEHIPQSAASR